MKLPLFFSSHPSKDIYFGLFLKERRGIGYILIGEKGKIRILSKREFVYSNGWENLVQDIDELLFKLEEETKSRVEKTIFFVFSHLIEEKTKEIKKPYLQKIKDIVKNLEIKPIGYIECQDAVVSFLQERESSPLSSILIELDDSFAGIFIYKGGHKMHSFIVARTDNIIDDIVSVFNSLGKTLLPNRIVMYNSGNLSHESSKIISHRWSSDLFVQLPRVEILKDEHIQEGLLRVFADQTYHETSSSFANPQSKKNEILGFVIGSDIKNNAESEGIVSDTNQREMKDRFPSQKTTNYFVLNNIVQITQKIKAFFVIPFWKPNKYFFIFFAFIFTLLSVFFTIEYFFHKTDLTLILPTKTIKKDLTIKSVFKENKGEFLPLFIATSSTTIKDIKATTGKRDIGERAKGEVTLFNFDDEEKTFAKGTIITVDNLKFSLDEEVKVSAATLTQDASAKLPGKKNVKVTALEIGTESNIDKNKRFKIEDLSLSIYFAMNDEAFSGGTKKTIKTVSKKDLDDLKNQILEKSKREQQETIKRQIANQVNLLEPLMKVKLNNITYSKELGEEGDNVSITAKVMAEYYYYKTQDMIAILKKHLNKEIPNDFYLIDTNVKYTVNSVDEEGDEITMKVKAEARIGKRIDEKNILQSIKGKSKKTVSNILNSNKNIDSYILIINPAIIPFKDYMPFFKQHIHISFQYK